MFVTTPPVYGIDDRNKNPVRQIAASGERLHGSLARFSDDRVRGWLFQSDSGDELLIVPPKVKPSRVSLKYPLVLSAELDDGANAEVDLSGRSWMRHPLLGVPNACQAVIDSWRGAFYYIQEDEERGIVGLRSPQIGAVHAVHAHWSVSDAPATIVMPTGTGKTETMLSVLVSAACPRVLVVVPTDALRTQIAEKFVSLGILKTAGSSILARAALYPTVRVLRHIPTSVQEVHALLEGTNVVVTTSNIAGQCSEEVQHAIANRCSHLFIDEAHHAEAPTWKMFKEQFIPRRVLQFTATPFREDGTPLDGKLIYVYPLRKAQAEGYFKPIRFINVIEFDPNRADQAIATAAIAQLRRDYDKGHILMARVDTISRAEKVFEIYRQYSEFNPVQLHTGIPSGRREEARRMVVSKQARIVVCVDMLGEGFDLPELKIAAFHDIRKTLPVTLQLAGRFTRTRPDLGDATFIANTADLSVRDELRKLYTRDPDWNVLLPDLSETMIGEQQSLQEFLRGFTEFVDEIPLSAVRPALSTVVYKTDCENWAPENVRDGIPNVSSCEQVHIAINEAEHTIVVVTARRLELPWADLESIFSWQWELYVLVYWPQESLLFVNGSTNAGEFRSFAQAIAGEGVQLIRGQAVFRSFAGVRRLRLNSVGLSEQLGRNVSFTSRMGADVAPVLHSTLLSRARKSVLSGTGYEGGENATVGASRKGRIWSHRRERVDQLVAWCKHVGAKLLDESIDPDEVLRGTLETIVVNSRPDGMPIGVDWPDEIYSTPETSWSISIGYGTRHISECELEIVDPTLDGPISFAIVTDDGRAEFQLEYFERGDTWDFQFRQRGQEAVRVVRADVPFDAAEFFTDNPPRVWFADGASLDGNEYTPLKSELPPYEASRIQAWDWTGVDIRKESQGDAHEKDSIQAAVIARLGAQDYDLIFDDDDAGEAADVVAVRVVGGADAPSQLDVEFYHCKFSSEESPGARIGDLYVVCGQAQTSIRWMSSPEKRRDLFTHLLRREAKRQQQGRPSRIQHGDRELLVTLREMTYTTRMTLTIAIVQPGVSKQAISQVQLRLLSVTENYLMDTYQLPFTVITSH